MPILDLFLYRQRRSAGGAPDVLVYDKLPEELKVQIVFIWEDAIGQYDSDWKLIHDTVARERGVLRLGRASDFIDCCKAFLLESDSADDALDLIEVSFVYIDRVARNFDNYDRHRRGIDAA